MTYHDFYFYIWAGLAGLLCILFVLKLVIQIGMAGSGRSADWSSYNALLFGLLIVVFPYHGTVRMSKKDAIRLILTYSF